jgi:cytochrome P450
MLSMFITAMTTYPEVQEKAQAELDRIVGPGRLPDFSDREDLIYVKALFTELMRWHQIAPFGKLFHNLDEWS